MDSDKFDTLVFSILAGFIVVAFVAMTVILVIVGK